MNIKKTALQLTIAVLTTALPASASLIVSESFWSSDAGGDYLSNTSFDNAGHNSTVAGNTGFSSGNVWAAPPFSGTTLVVPNSANLNASPGINDGLSGMARILAGGGERQALRQLASTPSGSTFYMSGLVELFSPTLDKSMTIGLNSGVIDFSDGVYLGMTTTNDGTFLSAFNGSNIYTLGDALAGSLLDETHQIVIEISFGETASSDSLTAWFAHEGDTELTHGTTQSGLELGSASDLSHFILQGRGASGDTSEMRSDEFRFGTTMSSVTAIPEPSTLGTFAGLSVFLLVLHRRFRR